MFDFKHLECVQESYFEHFCRGITYSFMSCRAGFYFLVHSFYPDVFEFDGSVEIDNLNKILTEKKIKHN